MLLYETSHSQSREYVSIHKNTNLCFQKHLHRSFELICVTEGSLELQIGRQIYLLKTGQAALILPCHIHAYHTPESSKNFLCIFSEDYLPDFCLFIRGKHVSSPVFTLDDPVLLRQLEYSREAPFAFKAALYRIVHLFTEACPFQESDNRDDPALLEQIISYVQTNFLKKLSLRDLAQELGYHYNYLSGFINRHLGLHFCAFVNLYRADYACELLMQPQIPVSEIAERCGFETIRSFNRNFLQFHGCTPQEYRRRREK